MRKALIVLLLTCALMLSGCLNAQVTYSLGENNSTSAAYNLTIELTDVQTKGYVNTIDAYWQDAGFTTSIDETSESIAISGTKNAGYESRTRAADAFADMLTEQDSMFDNINFEYLPSFEKDVYMLEATISLDEVIRQSQAQNIPDDELDALLLKARNGEYTLSISLPGEVTETNADSTKDGVCTWQLEYGKTTKLSMKTYVVNEENKSVKSELIDRKQRDNTLFWIGVISAAALLLALLTFIFVRRLLRIRASKVRVKKFR